MRRIRSSIKSRQDDSRQLLISVGNTGVGLQPEQAEQIFNNSLPPNLRGPEWDCPLAGPSSNRMAAACGPPIPDGAQPFSSAYPAKSLRMRPHSQATSVC